MQHEDEYKPAEKRNKKQVEWSKSDQLQIDGAVKDMLGTRQGRRYLYWLLDIGKAIGQNPFTGAEASTFFACGEQNVGQRIMQHLLDVSPRGFTQMLEEAENERTERRNVLDGIN